MTQREKWIWQQFFSITMLLIVLTSCGEKSEKTVAYDDLAPGSEKYKNAHEADSSKIAVKDERPEESPFLVIVDTLMPESQWVKWDTLLFADRFGPLFSEKWQTTGERDSLVLLRYTFKDSLRTRNAFFNWIDCFGATRKSYTVGDNIRIRGRAALWLVGEKEMVFIESGRTVDEKLVRTLLNKDPKKDPKKENWMYLITIPKSGKTIWKRITKGEEQPIIKTHEDS